MFCRFAGPMFAGRIAKRLTQDSSHGIRHLGRNGRAGIEIQIYAWSFHRLLHPNTPKLLSRVRSCAALTHACLRLLGATALDMNNPQDAYYQIIKRMIEYVKSDR